MSATLTFTNDAKRIPYTNHVTGEPSFYRDTVAVPGMNVCNSNARFLLACLGFNPNYDGSDDLAETTPDITLSEMIDACRLCLTSDIGTVLDRGTESTKAKGEGGCLIIHCGRPEGYLADRVTVILGQCLQARLAGATHCYFS